MKGKIWQTILSIIVNKPMTLQEQSGMPYLKSMAICLSKMVDEGYTEHFQITDTGLQSTEQNSSYAPEQVQVVNQLRFEGESEPGDNAILYVIETTDGTRGTL